jgi:broad specificity phosphatase PhoE
VFAPSSPLGKTGGGSTPRGVPYRAPMGELILQRHGETEWSRTGRHTGRTDVPLTLHGEEQAKALAPLIADREIVLTLTSPAQRAGRTAVLAGLTDAQIDDRLWEWDYGAYEGRTTPDIRSERPGWYLWSDGVLEGETVEQVGARVDAVIERVRPYLTKGDVALVAHGHVLRVLTARWLGLPPADGRLFRLDTGTISTLGTEHDRPVISSWNVPAR